MTPEEMLTISSSQLAALNSGHETMTAASEEIYLVEDSPQIVSDHGMWDCNKYLLTQEDETANILIFFM